MPSFDVVSRVDLQEAENAINQTRKEVAQRYDLKDTKTEIDWDQKEIVVTSADDFKVQAVVDVLQSKLVRRGVPIKNLDYGKIEPAAGGRARQKIAVQQGIRASREHPPAGVHAHGHRRDLGRRVWTHVHPDVHQPALTRGLRSPEKVTPRGPRRGGGPLSSFRGRRGRP